MSAITGTGEASRIFRNARTAASSGTATRTISHPSRASDRIWATVARTSRVSVSVMLCTEIGAPPPTGTSPTLMRRVFLRFSMTAITISDSRKRVDSLFSMFRGTGRLRGPSLRTGLLPPQDPRPDRGGRARTDPHLGAHPEPRGSAGCAPFGNHQVILETRSSRRARRLPRPPDPAGGHRVPSRYARSDLQPANIRRPVGKEAGKKGDPRVRARPRHVPRHRRGVVLETVSAGEGKRNGVHAERAEKDEKEHRQDDGASPAAAHPLNTPRPHAA